MQDTEIFERLEYFCTGGQGWEFSVNSEIFNGVEQEVNRVGRNLVGELILKIHGLVGYEHRFSFSHLRR